MRTPCPRCGRRLVLTSWRQRHQGVCRKCVNAGAVEAASIPAQVLPTVDIVIGHETPGPGYHLGRERLIRVQRVDRLIRLLAAVRVDDTAIQPLGTLTVPLRHIAELQQALARVANGHPHGTSKEPSPEGLRVG